MLKAVLFDMDGVLVDSEREYHEVQKKMGMDIGIELSDDGLHRFMGVAPLEMWTVLKAEYGFNEDPQTLADLETKMMDAHYESGDLNVIEPSVELLGRCKAAGLKTAIATSSEKRNADSVIAHLDIADDVDAVSTICMAGKSKPEPDIFLLAAEMLGVAPETCVVIEDSKSGVQAAKRAGMVAIGLRHEAFAVDFAKADMVVSSCDELDMKTLRSLMGDSD